MWRHRKVVSATAIALLAAACSDHQRPTISEPQWSRSGQFDVDPTNGARSAAADFDASVPIAYYQLSLDFTKQTAGFTPPVQARAFGYMGIALYEAVVRGMPDHRSVASQLNGIGSLPEANGIPYNWPLAANAALAEVMRGLWGDRTNRAADNIAALDALETQL